MNAHDVIAALTEIERHVRDGARSPDIDDEAYEWVRRYLIAAREMIDTTGTIEKPTPAAIFTIGKIGGGWSKRA